MVFPLSESRTPGEELLAFARECSWIDPDELNEIETLSPYMTDEECHELLASLQMEARLRDAPREG
jgi:hypothetical protein